MSQQHTPGPYKVETIWEKYRGYENWTVHTVRHAKTNVCLAVVGEVDAAAAEQNTANAHLFAAAPDLLKALESFVEAHDPIYVSAMAEDRERTLYDEVMDAAQAAIAKAKGK